MPMIPSPDTVASLQDALPFFKRSVCAISVALFLTSPLQADTGSQFTAPPFVVGESVVGKEGWEMLHHEPYPVFTDPHAAMLIDTLLIAPEQPTTLEIKTLLVKRGALKPGGVRRFETRFAITDHLNYSVGGGIYFRFAATFERSPFVLGYEIGNEGVEGGFYIQGEGERRIILPRSQVSERMVYTFVLDIDLMTETVSVRVTGQDISGQPFLFELESLGFQPGYAYSDRALDLHMGNNYPAIITGYIDYVKITDAP